MSENLERMRAMGSMPGWVVEHVERSEKRIAELEQQRDELQDEFSANVDHLDLMVDEFGRIRALAIGNQLDPAEVRDLCDRAIAQTKQRVPVIKQRDDLVRKWNEEKARAEKAECELAEAREKLKPRALTEAESAEIQTKVKEMAQVIRREALLEAADEFKRAGDEAGEQTLRELADEQGGGDDRRV